MHIDHWRHIPNQHEHSPNMIDKPTHHTAITTYTTELADETVRYARPLTHQEYRAPVIKSNSQVTNPIHSKLQCRAFDTYAFCVFTKPPEDTEYDNEQSKASNPWGSCILSVPRFREVMIPSFPEGQVQATTRNVTLTLRERCNYNMKY